MYLFMKQLYNEFMFLLHYKSGTTLTKVLIIFGMLLPIIGVTIFIVNFVWSLEILYYGIAIEALGILGIFFEYFYSKQVLTNLINPNIGLTSKSEKEFWFLNIDFERELFEKKDFVEYRESYSVFYSKLELKIKNPFKN